MCEVFNANASQKCGIGLCLTHKCSLTVLTCVGSQHFWSSFWALCFNSRSWEAAPDYMETDMSFTLLCDDPSCSQQEVYQAMFGYDALQILLLMAGLGHGTGCNHRKVQYHLRCVCCNQPITLS